MTCKDRYEINSYIRDIKAFSSKFQSIRFLHIRRSTNKLADSIAIESLRRNEEACPVGSVLGFAAVPLVDDFIRESD